MPAAHLLAEDVDVVVERGEVGERARVRELDSLVHGLDRLLVQRVGVLLRDDPLVGQALAEVQDRVAAPPLLDLLLCSVLLGVGHRVTAVAVGHGLDEPRLAVLARDPQRLPHRGVHVEHVHPVAARAGHAEPCRLLRQVGDRRVPLERGPHAELVVDDEEDHGQLPERHQVHGLPERALVACAVAEHADDRVVGLPVVAREGDAGGERQVAAHDPVAAEEAALQVEEMHRAAAALGAPVLTPEQLRHDGVDRRATGQRLAVLAVGREEVIAVAHGVDGADDRGLLADAEVEKAADLGLRVHLPRPLLEAPDEHHPLEDPAGGVGVRERVLRADVLGRPPLDGALRIALPVAGFDLGLGGLRPRLRGFGLGLGELCLLPLLDLHRPGSYSFVRARPSGKESNEGEHQPTHRTERCPQAADDCPHRLPNAREPGGRRPLSCPIRPMAGQGRTVPRSDVVSAAVRWRPGPRKRGRRPPGPAARGRRARPRAPWRHPAPSRPRCSRSP